MKASAVIDGASRGGAAAAARLLCAFVVCAVVLRPAISAPADARQYLTPPYDEMVHGTNPSLERDPRHIPRFRPGDVVAFFLTREGDIRTASCESVVTRPVVQPTATQVIPLARADGGVDVSVESVRVGEVRAGGGISPLADEVVVGSAAAGGDLASRSHGATVSETSSRGGLSFQDRTRLAVTEAAAGGQQSKHSDVRIGQETGSQELKPRTADVLAAEPATRGGSLHPRLGAFLLRLFGAKGGLLSLLESDFLAAVSESQLVFGYTDEEGNLVILDENEFLDMVTEWHSVASLYEEEADVLHYLDGLLTARFRREWTDLPKEPRYAASVECQVLPLTVYHGSNVGLLYTVRNVGNAPLFDVLLLSGVPAHAKYVAAGRAPGYAVSYADKYRTFLIRLLRPIRPGETFRTMVVVRMDPWILGDGEQSPGAELTLEQLR